MDSGIAKFPEGKWKLCIHRCDKLTCSPSFHVPFRVVIQIIAITHKDHPCFMSQWGWVIFKISEFFWNINSSSFVSWIKYLVCISLQFPFSTIILRPLTSVKRVKCTLILILPYSIVKCQYSSCLYIKFWEKFFFCSLWFWSNHCLWCIFVSKYFTFLPNKCTIEELAH